MADDVRVRICVVDDEPAVREALARSLTFEGYTVTTASDGDQALATIAAEKPDAIVLDVAMPVMDGLSVCRTLRSTGDATPVLMLTARAETSDRVAGLDAGADDYLVKPFALEELLARVRALLRRAAHAGPGVVGQPTELSFADLTMDSVSREVSRAGHRIDLTRTEYSLLELFLQHPRQVLTRGQIFESVWGYDFGGTSNALDVYIGYLRRKTEPEALPRLVHTVRGVGYVLRERP